MFVSLFLLPFKHTFRWTSEFTIQQELRLYYKIFYIHLLIWAKPLLWSNFRVTGVRKAVPRTQLCIVMQLRTLEPSMLFSSIQFRTLEVCPAAVRTLQLCRTSHYSSALLNLVKYTSGVLPSIDQCRKYDKFVAPVFRTSCKFARFGSIGWDNSVPIWVIKFDKAGFILFDHEAVLPYATVIPWLYVSNAVCWRHIISSQCKKFRTLKRCQPV